MQANDRIIQVISCTKIRMCNEIDVVEEMVGQKAMGLLRVPYAWRLPFFSIEQNVMTAYIEKTEQEKENLLRQVSNMIEECIRQWQYSQIDKIIIRSSGVKEGMEERGKYDSIPCLISDINSTLEMLFKSAEREGYGPIAYVIQPFVERKVYGHLSNERRVSRVSRDWKLEFENSQEDVYSLGVRYWRKKYDTEAISQNTLECKSKGDIKQILRKVAYFYTKNENEQRVHLEFVWNGDYIFIVQNDLEQHCNNEVNPKERSVMIEMPEELSHLKVFREVNKKEESVFAKIENVKKYAQLELPTAPFYELSDKQIIKTLVDGNISEDLEADIRLLVSHSIVVRTDVSKYEASDRQLLPRSNELRSFEQFMEWAKNKLPILLEYENIILLVHVFIPAVSAAFSYAMPDNRIVTIQSLWGLPEGLYYNTHDTTQVDTGSQYVAHIDVHKITNIKTRPDYKGFYYAPNDNGIWERMIPKPPYDWQMSITEDQARQIAWGSRLIAQKENKSLSIMWFVGVDKEYYQTDCLPWYHEEVVESTFSHDIYQKKYYTQQEKVISSIDDIDKLQDSQNIGAITIHPQDDNVLRDKDFLRRVGDFAKTKEVTVFLDGTILAHPVYRLNAQGVKVVLTKAEKMLFGWEQFNKLVRDKIPEKIQNNLESIKCYTVKGNVLLRYLKEKLVEEAYEVCDAITPEDIMEELSDVYEVMQAIRTFSIEEKRYGITRSIDIKSVKDAKLIQQIKVQELPAKYKEYGFGEKYFTEICLERTHQELELELRYSDILLEEKVQEEKQHIERANILYIAYQILDENDDIAVCQLCDKLEHQIMEMCPREKNGKQEILEICERKRKKNGGFQKGYVLRETNKATEKDNSHKYFLDLGEEQDENQYPEIKEMLFTPVTYIDFRETNHKELILRIKYPLCFEKWSNEFSKKSVDNMFGLGSKIYVFAEREGGIYTFSIYLEKDTYQQMQLEFYEK